MHHVSPEQGSGCSGDGGGSLMVPADSRADLQIGIVVLAGGIAGKERWRIRLLLANHDRENRRNHQQRGHGRHHQAADDGPAERAFHLAARSSSSAIGTMPIGHGAGGHQDRPQSLARPGHGRLGADRPLRQCSSMNVANSTEFDTETPRHMIEPMNDSMFNVVR